MRSVYAMLLMLWCCGCKNYQAKCTWANRSSTIDPSTDSLLFTSDAKHWQACIYTIAQPLIADVEYTRGGFVLKIKNAGAITNGPATLVLKNSEHYFTFHINLVSRGAPVVKRIEYRSPKTVNPDSGLIQHRMLHYIDAGRNIVARGEATPFFESTIGVSAKAGTYYAEQGNPLSAYYVQPGSCTAIQLSKKTNADSSGLQIQTNVLQDKYDNIIADGTVVRFVINTNENISVAEALTRDGIATITIPELKSTFVQIQASVHSVVSPTLNVSVY